MKSLSYLRGYFDTVEKRWNTDLLNEQNFPINLLPTVVDAGADAGNLLQKWFFIPERTPITAGMGDLQVFENLLLSKRKINLTFLLIVFS